MADLVATPHPALQKLDYFVGSWTVEGTITAGSWGAGGRFGWTDTTEWMKGNFFVIGHWDFQMPSEMGGDGEEIFIMGYDANQNVYTFDAFSSQGLHQISKGTISGDTWIWTSHAVQGGRETQQKMTMQILSPIAYSLKFELSPDGSTWTTYMEGKATKK